MIQKFEKQITEAINDQLQLIEKHDKNRIKLTEHLKTLYIKQQCAHDWIQLDYTSQKCIICNSIKSHDM